MKVCSVCQENKELIDFYAKGICRSGKPKISSVCKVCHNLKVKEWQAKNKEKVREYVRKSCKKAYHANPEKYRSKTTEARLKNPEAYKFAISKAYYKKQTNLNEAEKLRRRLNSANWREANLGKSRLNVKLSRQRHPERHANYQSFRRTKKLQATPNWLSAIQIAQIQEFYEISSALTTQTGVKHHVDHICPLLGKNVKGLHVPWNLQVIPAVENIRKSNRIEGV